MLKVVQTCGINSAVESCEKFAKEIDLVVGRYWGADWGDTCASDCKMNDRALKSGERIVALYRTSKGKVFIITDCGHVVTTILFAHEY